MLRRVFDPNLPHRYVCYGRMSDPRQNSRSPDQQFDTIDREVRRLGRPWVHVGNYRDDGISGRYLRKRSGLQQLLAAIRTGTIQVDLILVDTAERFGRVDQLTAIRDELYSKHGVLVLTADSHFADPTTVQGRALTFVEEMRTTEDGRIKAHNVLRGKRDAARRKRWPGGNPPFGYALRSVLVDRNGRQEVDHCVLVPDPKTSWIIRRLFDLAHETGRGTTFLASELNEDPEIPEEHKPFSADAVRYWLSNPIYHGELLWEKNATGIVDDMRVVERNAEEDMLRVPDFCEPIVSREVWDAVAALRAARSAAHARAQRKDRTAPEKQIRPLAPGLTLKYLLTGLVRCGLCGRSMRPMPSGRTSKAGKRYLYYACPGALVGSCTNRRYVPEPWLREAVLAKVRARLFPAPTLA